MIYVLAGPSGSGKTAQAGKLSEREDFKRVVTATTRSMRMGEVDRVDYYFLTREEFQKGLDEDAFFAVTNYAGHFYGIPKLALEEYRDSVSRHLVMVLDKNGVMALKKWGAYIIVLTLDEATLKARMLERGDEVADVEQRLRDGEGLLPYADLVIDSRNSIEYNEEKIGAFIDETIEKGQES